MLRGMSEDTTEPPLPHHVQAATRQHLRALDTAALGLVTALYGLPGGR
jgi:hypothetical protein